MKDLIEIYISRGRNLTDKIHGICEIKRIPDLPEKKHINLMIKILQENKELDTISISTGSTEITITADHAFGFEQAEMLKNMTK